jgi:hypothetical protein
MIAGGEFKGCIVRQTAAEIVGAVSNPRNYRIPGSHIDFPSALALASDVLNTPNLRLILPMATSMGTRPQAIKQKRPIAVLNRFEKPNDTLESLIDILGTLIEDYENKHVPEPVGNPISSLKHFMREHNLKQSDLSEIRNWRRSAFAFHPAKKPPIHLSKYLTMSKSFLYCMPN